MKIVFSVLLGALFVLGSVQNVKAGSCSGDVTGLKLREEEDSNDLYIMWTAPAGESGCTYTVKYATEAPGFEPMTFETDDLFYTIEKGLLVPCSATTISVSTTDGNPVSVEAVIETRPSTAPILLDMTTSCDSIQMTWEGQPYAENMCTHTHFQLFCLSDTHNFTVPVNVVDEENRIFEVTLTTVLQPDVFYTCNGYMFVTLAGFSPASEDIQFWSNLDSVRDLKIAEVEGKIRASWEPPLNSEECGVGYYVTYENEVVGEGSQETTDLWVDLDAEVVPCTEYKISVTPIAFTGSHGTYVYEHYEPAVTQGSVEDLVATDNSDSLTLSWKSINIGRCDVHFVVSHYVDGELHESVETVDSSVPLERIPCSDNRFEVTVVTEGDHGSAVSAELNLSAADIEEVGEVRNIVISGNEVTWDAPISVGRCGVMYEVVLNGGEANIVSETRADLELIPCSENVVTVRGIAGTLEGEPTSVEFTADSIDLDAPENLRTIPDFTMATLTMQAESRDVNACPITEVLITCTREGDDVAFGDSQAITDNEERIFEIDVSGLETDSIYDCTLRWSNSPMSSNIRFRTIPIPRKQLTVGDVTETGFTVSWTEDYGEEFVKDYRLVVVSNGPNHAIKEGCEYEDKNEFVFELGAGDLSQVFVEGFADFGYDIELTTTYNLGSLGVTDLSELLMTDTLVDVPGAPEDLAIAFDYVPGEAYNVTGIVTWTAPCELNGALRSFGVNVAATFDLGGTEHTLEYGLDVAAESPDGVFTYELRDINPFFRYVVTVNTLAALEGPGRNLIINPPDICTCDPEG